jgi:proteasome lid subunit RPN8/RPN11
VAEKCKVSFDTDDNLVEIVGDLPGREGVSVHRQITPREMVYLSRKYKIEFGLARRRKLVGWKEDQTTPLWKDNEYWLFSATKSDPTGVSIPYLKNLDEYWVNIYHTHLNGKTTPSGSDMIDLATRWWQESSGIIPVDDQPPRVILFDKNTPAFD